MAQELSPIVSRGDLTYYVLFDQRAGVLPLPLVSKLARFDQALVPSTVIEWPNIDFTPADLDSTCQSFGTKDDVWSADFLSRESDEDSL